DRPVGYVPVDISGEHLVAAAEDLKARFGDLEVLPVVADFTRAFELPQPSSRAARRTVLFFPGSTLGNFTRKEAARLLAEWRDLVGDDGTLLIGVDLKKDRALLEAAYND